MATHIKTIKNESGDTIDIVVDISSMHGYTGSTPCHSIKIADLRIKRYKKRTWEEIGQAVSDNYKFRRLPLGKERELYKMQIFLQHITPEQAKAAIWEAYEAIAPDTSIIDTAAEINARRGGGQA